MKRADALKWIKYHASQNDMASCTRVFIESKLSREAYNQAIDDGREFGAFIKKRDEAINAAPI